MKRLWIRLSIAFTAVVLLGMVSILIVSTILLRFDTSQTPIIGFLQSSGGLVESLQNYYRQNRTWDGVDTILAGADSLTAPSYRLIFTVQESATQVIHSAVAIEGSEPVTSLPILLDNQQIGTLNMLRIGFDPSTNINRQSFVLESLRDFLLLVAAVGGIVGILFGVLVSRNLTAPLVKLAAAAQAIGARRPYSRVEAKGTTEIVELANAFNDMASALEASQSVRRNLLADVAHELRTPLSVLQGNLLALLDGVYPLDTSEIARLYSQTHLLNRLVNDLHELSLAEAHQLHLHLQLTDIQAALDTIRDAFAPTAEVAGVKLHVSNALDLPLVLLDPLRLTEILDNLLGNALRHTPTGGSIFLHADVGDGKLRITVRDTGDGISAEHLPYIFDRFYRTNRGRSRATGGAGLGLAIVRAIVEMHDGQVSVHSDSIPGHGATFTVQIPLKEPPSKEGQDEP